MPLSVDPQNPFPLTREGEYSYQEEQAHSEAVDQLVGLRTQETEASVKQKRKPPGQETWQDFPPSVFLTPYTECRRIVELLKLPKEGLIVDLGAGYARMGFVVGRHYRDILYLGYELVSERVEAANRALAGFAYDNVQLVCKDIAASNFSPPPADCYFIYDFGSREAIEKILEDLKQYPGVTVVGRGRGVRDAIERRHPWLGEVNPPQHLAHFSIYRS